MAERDPRLCTHRRDDGSFCSGWKVRGETLCASHLGLGAMAAPSHYGTAGARRSAQVRQEAARRAKKRAIDVYREAVEEHAQWFVDVRLAIIDDPTSTPNERLTAMSQLEERALGKPVAPTAEVEMPTETDRELDAMTPEQREQLLRQLERKHGGSLVRLVQNSEPLGT